MLILINQSEEWYGVEVLLIAQLNPLGVPKTKLKADILLDYHGAIMTKESRQRYLNHYNYCNWCIMDVELHLFQVILKYHVFGH